MKKHVLLIILVFAFLLRFWNVSKYPEAIDEDEMALGYYGYSLIHAGTDEYGNKFPIYFKSVGDFKYGLYSYFAAIPVGIFGLSPLTARLVSVFAGVASVFAVYLLAFEISRNKSYALLTAFVLAVSPTHIHFSRVAYSNVLGATFAVFSLVYFIRCLKKGGLIRKNVVSLFVFFTLALFSYQAYRIFLPATFLLIFPIFAVGLKRRDFLPRMLLIFAAILIVFASFISRESRARASGLSTLIEQPKIDEQIAEDGYVSRSIFVTRLFHNKAGSVATGFLKRYISYFDPGFLFVEVSPADGRHTTPGVGLLYLIEAPLLLFGLLGLGLTIKGREKFVPIILVFSAPLAASLVLDSTSVTRSVILVYVFSLLISLGIYYLSQWHRVGKILLMGVFCLYFVSLFYFIHQYFIHKVYHHPWYGDFGLGEMVSEVNKRGNDYSAVVVSAGHYIPFLFYNHTDPTVFKEQSEFLPGGGVIRYGKIYFNMPEKCPLAGKRNVLYVCFGYQVPTSARVLRVIYFRDGQPAIFLIEFTGDEGKSPLPERLEYFKSSSSVFPDGIIPADYPSFWSLKGI